MFKVHNNMLLTSAKHLQLIQREVEVHMCDCTPFLVKADISKNASVALAAAAGYHETYLWNGSL